MSECVPHGDSHTVVVPLLTDGVLSIRHHLFSDLCGDQLHVLNLMLDP